MITGGTSSHLLLVDVWVSFGMGGREAETLLDHAGITLNMNSVADDTRKPMDPSGIRFGTPAITTRGFMEKDCAKVAELMIECLRNKDSVKIQKRIREDIRKMAKKMPVPTKFV